MAAITDLALLGRQRWPLAITDVHRPAAQATSGGPASLADHVVSPALAAMGEVLTMGNQPLVQVAGQQRDHHRPVNAALAAAALMVQGINFMSWRPDAALQSAPRGAFLQSAPRGAFLLSAPRGAFLLSAPRGAFLLSAPRGAFLLSAPRGAFLLSAPRGAFLLSAPRGAFLLSAPRGATPETPSPVVVTLLIDPIGDGDRGVRHLEPLADGPGEAL